MLTNRDIEYIRESREYIRGNREDEVTLIGEQEGEEDPVTGESDNTPYEKEVDAVVTMISVRTAVDRSMSEGIEIQKGDITVDINIGDMPEDITAETIEYVKFDGVKYTVINSNKLGLGEINRIEVLGRRTS